MKVQVFEDGEVFIEAEFLGHVSDMALQDRGLGGRIEAKNPHVPAIGAKNAGQYPQKGGLSRSVRTNEAGDRAFAHIERHIVQSTDDATRGGKCPDHVPEGDGRGRSIGRHESSRQGSRPDRPGGGRSSGEGGWSP